MGKDRNHIGTASSESNQPKYEGRNVLRGIVFSDARGRGCQQRLRMSLDQFLDQKKFKSVKKSTNKIQHCICL